MMHGGMVDMMHGGMVDMMHGGMVDIMHGWMVDMMHGWGRNQRDRNFSQDRKVHAVKQLPSNISNAKIPEFPKSSAFTL